MVDQACDWLGYSVVNGHYRKTTGLLQDHRIARSLAKQRKKRANGANSNQESEVEISDAIRDLFPKIPERDLKAIVKHAFREVTFPPVSVFFLLRSRQGTDVLAKHSASTDFSQGAKRVGNAAELTLPRRVQLAVIAHIRHEYTDYDSYLKTGSYIEARSRVEAECVDQLLKWRGEDDKEGSVELEESFRETIVIDDSEDEEDESDTITIGSDQGDRAPSLEIVTSRAQPQDLHANDVASAHWIDSHRDAARGPGVYYVRPRVRPATLQRPARRLVYARAPQLVDERTAPAYAVPTSGQAQEQRYIEDRHGLRPVIR